MLQKNDKDLVHQVYLKLKEMILSGDLKPGEKVYQEKIAEKIGVSRTPLVKAFLVLEQEMLLQSKPHRGMYVSNISVYDLLEAFECRQGIETTAIRIVTGRITSEELEDLKSIFNPFLNSNNINNEDYLLADSAFHHQIIKLSNNKYLIKMNQIYDSFTQTYKLGLIREPSQTLSEHLIILSAIEMGDASLAEEYMRNHIRKSIERIKLSIVRN
ncbi:MAG: GntR family transcriptional regulator [Bacteroidia bacterium]|nr:GntR family transcriptional regulator [Bacteroidia bacterium]